MKTQKFILWMCIGALLAAFVLASGCIGGDKAGEPQENDKVKKDSDMSADTKVDDKKKAEDKDELEDEIEDAGEKKDTEDEQEGEGGTGDEKEEKEEEKDTLGNRISEIIGLGKPAGYTVSYDITGEGMDGASKMTFYLKSDRMRMDQFIEYEGETSEISIYGMDNKVYICSKTEGVWQCFTSGEKMEDETDFMGDISGKFEHDEPGILYEGTQVIEGIKAQCYKIESGGDKYRYCVHPEKYLMLLGESYIGGQLQSRMIATRVDLSAPSDSVFKLPVEPVDMEDIMEDMAGGDMCAMCEMIPEGPDKRECLETC